MRESIFSDGPDVFRLPAPLPPPCPVSLNLFVSQKSSQDISSFETEHNDGPSRTPTSWYTNYSKTCVIPLRPVALFHWLIECPEWEAHGQTYGCYEEEVVARRRRSVIKLERPRRVLFRCFFHSWTPFVTIIFLFTTPPTSQHFKLSLDIFGLRTPAGSQFHAVRSGPGRVSSAIRSVCRPVPQIDVYHHAQCLIFCPSHRLLLFPFFLLLCVQSSDNTNATETIE